MLASTVDNEPRSRLANDYAFILDAGSSGTRLFVYEWKHWSREDFTSPAIRNPFTYKRGPGISTMIRALDDDYYYRGELDRGAAPGTPDQAKARLQSKVDAYLKPLFDSARAFAVGARLDPTTIPLFVLGTAGIRGLLPDFATRYNDLIRCMTKSSKDAKFDFQECGAITGEEEALYGWIAANCTLAFRSGWSSETLGYAEMGGASAQIAFSFSRALEHNSEAIWKVTLGTTEFELFLGSYPLGMDKGVELYHKTLIDEHLKTVNRGRRTPINDDDLRPEQKVVIDPGRPRGFGKTFGNWTLQGPDYERTTVTPRTMARNPSIHPSIQTVVNPLGPQVGLVITDLERVITSAVNDAVENSEDPPLKSLHPFKDAIKAHNFVGGANFWYSTRMLFGVDSKGNPMTTAFSFAEFRLQVTKTLAVRWADMGNVLPYAKPEYLEEAWIKAMWANEVLTRQFGLDNDGDPTKAPRLTFKPFDGFEGMELSWTMGRLVRFITGDYAPRKVAGVRRSLLDRGAV